jgi:signal transduction histidine kinase
MTPRKRLAGRLRASLFLKILMVFLGAFTAIALYSVTTFWLFDWQQQRLSVRQSAMNYAGLIMDELADPPDTAQARSLAERLGVGMRIEGPSVAWVSGPDFPLFDDVDLPAVVEGGPDRAGLSRALGFGADVVRGDYRYMFSLQAGRIGLGSDSATEEITDLLFMAILLACVYFVTRYLLRPVRVLAEGVDRLREGDLDVSMPTRRTDELGQLMVSFEEMARAVRERLRSRDQLLTDVSHEIRSPLTRMRLALEMMPDGAARASVIEDIEEIETMIVELLETERLDSPHGGISRAPDDVARLVAECAEQRLHDGPGVEVEGVGHPVVAHVDSERVRVVVGNLLSNALRHSASDGPPVRVSLEERAGDVTIQVMDRGVGIPEEDISRVFEPFYRVDRSRSKDTGGYGIGLSLVKRIVEAHGGTIRLESREGEGTSVLVSLPVDANGNSRRKEGPRW